MVEVTVDVVPGRDRTFESAALYLGDSKRTGHHLIGIVATFQYKDAYEFDRVVLKLDQEIDDDDEDGDKPNDLFEIYPVPLTYVAPGELVVLELNNY